MTRWVTARSESNPNMMKTPKVKWPKLGLRTVSILILLISNVKNNNNIIQGILVAIWMIKMNRLKQIGEIHSTYKSSSFWVHAFGVIQIRISDPRSLGSRCIKGTDESTLVLDSSVPLMHYDPSDLGSLILIQIIPKERSL